MERHLPTRREFIKDSSMAAMLLLLLGTGGCESILDQIRNRPIRRMINPSSPDSSGYLQERNTDDEGTSEQRSEKLVGPGKHTWEFARDPRMC